MNYIKQTAFCLALICSMQTQAQEAATDAPSSSQPSIAVYIRPYNVIWQNSIQKIISEVGSFIKNNPGLSIKLATTTTLVPQAIYLALQKKSVSHYDALFERTNPTGEIKALAQRLTVNAKKDIASGADFAQWCKDQGYTVSYLTSLPESLHEPLMQRFACLQLAKNLVHKPKENNEAFYAQLRAAEPAQRAFLVAQNNNPSPEMLNMTQEAGFELLSFDHNDPDCVAALQGLLVTAATNQKVNQLANQMEQATTS